MIDQNTDTGEQSFRKLYTINIPPQNADVLFMAIPSVPWGDTPIQDFQPQGAYLAKEGVPKVDPSWSSPSSSSIIIIGSSGSPSSSDSPSSSSSESYDSGSSSDEFGGDSSSSYEYSSESSSESSSEASSDSGSSSSSSSPTGTWTCELGGYPATGTYEILVTAPPGYINSGNTVPCRTDTAP